MKFVTLLAAVLSLVVQSGCASKKSDSASSQVASEPEVKAAAPTKFYYSDLQILTETSAIGDCTQDRKVVLPQNLQTEASLEDSKIKAPEGAFKFWVANVSLQMIGFDEGSTAFSVFDGRMPSKIPFGIQLRRVPGNILQLNFLDQEVQMKLQTTPIYTFTAKEDRSGCEVTHHVNVFGERTSYYPLQ